MQTTTSLYQSDYVAWVDDTILKLRAHDFDAIDWDQLIEEVEDLGGRHRDALESNLIILLAHLLKWQHQPEFRSGSPKGSIVEHRRRINRAVPKMPSLNPHLDQCFTDCYEDARDLAIAETGLTDGLFPITCSWETEQVLERGWLP